MSKARLLWTSDQEIASDCQGRWAGGFSSPVVADGRASPAQHQPVGLPQRQRRPAGVTAFGNRVFFRSDYYVWCMGDPAKPFAPPEAVFK